MATKPIKFLELHYMMTQFLIMLDIVWARPNSPEHCENGTTLRASKIGNFRPKKSRTLNLKSFISDDMFDNIQN